MQVLRRRLPSGIVGVIFCYRAIVVDDRLRGASVTKVVAMAADRCNGCFAVVTQAEFDRVWVLTRVTRAG